MTRRRHSRTFDLAGIGDPNHREVIQGALNACTYPFGRVRRGKGGRVPVEVTDLSRYIVSPQAQAAADHDDHQHHHFDYDGDTAHVTASPANRRQPLGLAWYSGRVSVDTSIMGDVPLAQEVFVSEAAHMVDFFAMTDLQRAHIRAVIEPNQDDGWFEEKGQQDYWSWAGESFMSLFLYAYAPGLQQPLAASQPWTNPATVAMAPDVRRILRPPT